jgi:hypothetical protein
MSEIVDRNEFPSNSVKSKKEKMSTDETPKKVKRIVSGQVSKKRNSLGNSITQTLFGNDAKSVVSYIFYDVLIPAAKTTLSEMVSGGIEMLLFGESTGRRSSRNERGQTYVSYGKYYRSGDRRSERIARSDTPFRSLARAKYEDVVIEDRGEAEDVLENLVDLIDQYNQATLADFYDLVGMESTFADNSYGWTNLGRAQVIRVRDGYTIIFPKPRQLD